MISRAHPDHPDHDAFLRGEPSAAPNPVPAPAAQGPIQPSPIPVTLAVQRVGLPEQPWVRFDVWSPFGQVTFFLPVEFAMGYSKLIAEQSTGLTLPSVGSLVLP